MKKFFALALILLLLIQSALADTDKEIVFHGIPWGISINELVDQLNQRKITVTSEDIEANADLDIWTYQFGNSYEYNVDATGYHIRLNYYSAPGTVKIAGFPVSSMELFSHYGAVDEAISYNADDSKYYLSKVTFDVSDEMAVGVYSDLSNKLTVLYKTGTESTTKYGSSTYTYTVWNGSNNTAVCLFRSISTSSDYQFVYLMYGKTDSEQTLREVRRLVIEHEIQSVADDTTGL